MMRGENLGSTHSTIDECQHTFPEFSLFPTMVWHASLQDSGFCEIKIHIQLQIWKGNKKREPNSEIRKFVGDETLKILQYVIITLFAIKIRNLTC